jgi:hypothetical protein
LGRRARNAFGTTTQYTSGIGTAGQTPRVGLESAEDAAHVFVCIYIAGSCLSQMSQLHALSELAVSLRNLSTEKKKEHRALGADEAERQVHLRVGVHVKCGNVEAARRTGGGGGVWRGVEPTWAPRANDAGPSSILS